MQKRPIIQKELTLIEGLVANSMEIIKLKNSIHLFSEALFSVSKCKYRLIDASAPSTIVKELRGRISEIEISNANAFKAAYSHQYAITLEKLHFTVPEMSAGHVSLYVGKNPKRRVILFLSDVTPDLLDTIKEGEVKEYDKDLEQLYLPHCKAVWKSNSLNDLYLEHLKLLIK